jgi:ribosome-associated protein
VNTADSRVQLSFDLANSGSMSEFLRERALARLSSKLIDGVITITASEQRSQLQNRKAAEQRLAQILREAIAPPARTRRATRPTKGSVERRLNTKKTRSVTKRLRRSGASNHD